MFYRVLEFLDAQQFKFVKLILAFICIVFFVYESSFIT